MINNDNTSHYDIVIVGSGLVGNSLAVMLADRGWRIAIIEKSMQDNSANIDQRSIVLSYSSQQILAALNIWTELAVNAYPIQKIHVVNAGSFGMARFDTRDIHIPVFGYVVPAASLTRVLKNAILTLLTEKKIDLLCPAEIKKVSHDGEIELQLNDQLQTIHTQLLIAADGTYSTVRRLLAIETEIYDYQQTAIIAQLQLKQDHQQIAYERLTTTGPLAILPREKYHAGLIWSVSTAQVSEIMSYSDQHFLQELQQCFGYRLGKFQAVTSRSNYPLKLIYAKKQIYPGIVLLGNAAHTLHPLAGQGFNLGLRDAACLAEILLDARAVNQSLRDYAILEKYYHWRAADQENIRRFTDRTVKLFAKDFFKPYYSTGLIALDLLPVLKRHLTKRLLGMAGKTPKLACGVKL